MELRFETKLTADAMTVAARALRKTLRGKRSRLLRIWGWLIFAFDILMLIPLDGEAFVLDVRIATTLLAGIILLSALLFEDRLNGLIGRKKTLCGTAESVFVFTDESYTSITALTESHFRYELIAALAESENYFVLLLDKNHVQPVDKRTLTGGTPEEFKHLLTEKTGKSFRKIR